MTLLPNIITLLRIAGSLGLLLCDVTGVAFWVIYGLCGISDMVDGWLARKLKCVTKTGALLDSLADICFVACCAWKLLPILQLPQWLWLWAGVIVAIKIVNQLLANVMYGRCSFPHTLANKVTGFLLFIAVPMTFHTVIPIAIVASIATFAAIHEWHYIGTNKVGQTMKRVFALALTLALTLSSHSLNLIPMPAEYSVRPGSVCRGEMANLREKVRISEKALLRHLEGRKLADWQLKSAYWLELREKGVKIVAADEEGVFYARQTLKMMTSLDSSPTCCSILDWPRFRYRGVMLDESRHFQGKDFVKKQLEMMALLKMNRFHFHLVDNPGWRVQIDAYPRLTKLTAWRPQAFFWDWEKNAIGGPFVEEGTPDAYGGYYTKQDIAEILTFAAERHIEVIPEIEMPGHNYETRYAYPELACSLPNGGKDPWELCPGKESTFEFLENVLLEVFDMFPSQYIHIGGDEARKNNWKLCPDCQARMKAEGLKSAEELQSYMIKRMERFAHQHGKRIIGWDEILQGGLAPDATVMSWHGIEAGLQAVKEGHDVIFTPTHYYYLDYHQDPAQFRPVGRLVSLEKVYSFDPMAESISEADAHHVLGVQGNLWTEHVQDVWHAEMMLYPRVFAIAETGWSQPENKDWPSFEQRSAILSATARKWGYTVYPPLPPELINKP